VGAIATITALDHPPAGRKRLRLWLDGDVWRTTSSRVGRALDLSVGQDVRPDDLEQELDQEESRQAREHALRYLTYRARSRGELTRRLSEQGYGPTAVERTVQWLDQAGYLNDGEFAEQWVAERVRIKQYGRLRIAAELAAKEIPADRIGELLEEHCPESGERARATALARRRLAGLRGLERVAQGSRLAPYLLRKGYAAAVVRSVVADVALDDGSEEARSGSAADQG
jgi:regulatory protein